MVTTASGRRHLASVLDASRGRVPTPDARGGRSAAVDMLQHRKHVLTMTPDEAGIETGASGSAVWGCVVETGYENSVATLTYLRDGTATLCTSTGVDLCDHGEHEQVTRAGVRLLRFLEDQLEHMAPYTDLSPPHTGRTIIRALTASGQHTFEGYEDDLADGASALSASYLAAQELVTQLRLATHAK